MMRPSTIRLAAPLQNARLQSTRKAQQSIRFARPIPTQSSQLLFKRAYADAVQSGGAGGGGGGGNGMYIVLGALGVIAVGGYFFLKPVVDVASGVNQTVKSVKGTVQDGTDQYGDTIASLAKSVLPPGAMGLYSMLSNASGGSINGLLSSLKDKDLQGVLEEIKTHGNDDVKRIVDKVERRLKDAKGKVADVDWKALAEELKKELPEGSQKYIDMFIGKIPSKEDYEKFVSQLKDAGEKKKKELEASASKLVKEIEKAKKDGKTGADAYIKGLKEAAPADVEDLIKQIKDAAKSAGLPADTIESWLKSKAEDGKVDAEAMAKNLAGKLKMAAKFLPGEPKDLINQVKEFSPSLANLLAQAMQEAELVDDKLNRRK